MNTTFLGPLFPDESVWSGTSRAMARYPSGNLSKLHAMFGVSIRRSIHFAFPLELRRWAEIFGYRDEWRPFLANHTMWPWLSPFLAGRPNVLKEFLQSPGPPHGRFSRYHPFVEFSELCLDAHLKACRECYAHDVGRFGVPYWHSIHQLRGLQICPHHESPLITTRVRFPDAYQWHYTTLGPTHLQGAYQTSEIDPLQRYLASQILTLPNLEPRSDVGHQVRTALWDAGFPLGCAEFANMVPVAINTNLGPSAGQIAEELGEWKWILFGRAVALPMHLLVISYLLKMSPTRLINYGMRSHLKGENLDKCVSGIPQVQHRRSRRYRRLLGLSLVQLEGIFCGNCRWRLTEAHPRTGHGAVAH